MFLLARSSDWKTDCPVETEERDGVGCKEAGRGPTLKGLLAGLFGFALTGPPSSQMVKWKQILTFHLSASQLFTCRIHSFNKTCVHAECCSRFWKCRSERGSQGICPFVAYILVVVGWSLATGPQITNEEGNFSQWKGNKLGDVIEPTWVEPNLGRVVREGFSEEVTTGLRFDGWERSTYRTAWWSLLSAGLGRGRWRKPAPRFKLSRLRVETSLTSPGARGIESAQ